MFPTVRNRRLRSTPAIRHLVREHQVSIHDLIHPLFVIEGEHQRREITSMPGVFHLSLDQLDIELKQIVELGIQAVLLFGVPPTKDAQGSSAFDSQGIVQRATKLIKERYPRLLVITDTCLCQYTDSGHCGVIEHHPHTGQVDVANDASLLLLTQVAISQARAGADVIAPSNMMDGTVSVIRAGLDQAGYAHVAIMAYAVKYASAFYGPFRDAAHSTPQMGDRKSYQMDPANAREALREASADAAEGADFLMVKPALAYMDIILRVREQFQLPIVAYHVSAEYAMVKAAAQQGWIDEQAIVMETMVGFKRAGADLVITYYASDIARWLRERGV
jgi:porphobilinogen synthase